MTPNRLPIQIFGAAFLAGCVVLAVAFAQGYGIHRDELYFIDCANRLDWGYVDHSLAIPLLARLLGGNLLLMQLVTIAAVAMMAVIGAIWCRRLGGSAGQQALAATLFLSMPGVIGGAGTFGTVVFEQLNAAALGFFALSLGPRRLAPALATAFLAGLIKPSGILLCGGFAVLLLLTDRDNWRLGVGLVLAAMVGAAPWLVWQAGHGWPFLEFAAAQREERDPAPVFLLMSLIMLGPFAWVALARSVKTVAPKPELWFAGAGILLFLILQGKPYYAVPFFFPLLAEVSVARELPPRWGILAVCVNVLLLLPVWPPQLLSGPYFLLQIAGRERIDWKEWTAGLERTSAETGTRQVITTNYGQAAALRQLSVAGLQPICGHNQNAFWELPELDRRVLVVGYSANWLSKRFRQVRSLGWLTNRFDISNEEAGRPVSLVEDPLPGTNLAADLQHFD